MKRTERAHLIAQALDQLYPTAHCELNFSNPLQLLIATILSAQCTDAVVNQVTPHLFSKYPDAKAYAQAPLKELENDIRKIGLYRNKAKNIQSCCAILVERYQGQVPSDLQSLIELPGVGRKTANVILGNAFNINAGFVVDTHIARLSKRWRLTRHHQPEKIERDLIRLFPQESWTRLSHQIIWHGRRCCKARRPLCHLCSLASLCPSAFSEFQNRSHQNV
ncbi:MAG: endonuclease III [Methylacidiphilales bacterium]|nr:endonuclease III [Candidatus Methylacidiphilales bacterium]MDW8349566.1 endonuclease III [Verrucomicrobiae bacterium]